MRTTRADPATTRICSMLAPLFSARPPGHDCPLGCVPGSAWRSPPFSWFSRPCRQGRRQPSRWRRPRRRPSSPRQATPPAVSTFERKSNQATRCASGGSPGGGHCSLSRRVAPEAGMDGRALVSRHQLLRARSICGSCRRVQAIGGERAAPRRRLGVPRTLRVSAPAVRAGARQPDQGARVRSRSKQGAGVRRAVSRCRADEPHGPVRARAEGADRVRLGGQRQPQDSRSAWPLVAADSAAAGGSRPVET